ncbi:response regulator [Chryseobacterium sp. JUb7]|uniref:response regulator n=1 Tax=Chryseobacterium sp. JUb7 TaxID=2940599 RepID=UPI002169A4FC|nr:response regulator [Chryseobacterium sp. JUb7]MCS3529937.1 CheY-like chemotaxis protein [Chryseobacterium sp. JUb7]
MNKEFLNVILADDDEANQILLKNIFKELKIDIKVQCFNSGLQLLDYLNSKEGHIPEVLFMNSKISGKNIRECIQEIKSESRLGNIVIAVYGENLPDNEIEDFFILGANVFIRKPDNYPGLKKIVSEVVTITWQYHTSGLNKDNFILKI